MCLFLYSFWRIIQDGEARTTPAKAAGFLLIPLYNLYWIFVSFCGLAVDMNKYTRTRSIPAPIINEQLALTVCILTCLGVLFNKTILTDFGFAIMTPVLLAGVVMQVLVMKSMKDSAIAIVRNKQT